MDGLFLVSGRSVGPHCVGDFGGGGRTDTNGRTSIEGNGVQELRRARNPLWGSTCPGSSDRTPGLSGDLRLAPAKSDQLDASMAVEVAVVISSRNRAAFLPDLQAALSAQTYGRDRFEVVIVDDASTDDTWSVLESATRHT